MTLEGVKSSFGQLSIAQAETAALNDTKVERIEAVAACSKTIKVLCKATALEPVPFQHVYASFGFFWCTFPC